MTAEFLGGEFDHYYVGQATEAFLIHLCSKIASLHHPHLIPLPCKGEEGERARKLSFGQEL